MAYSTYQAKNGVGVTGCFGGSFVYHGIGGNGYECPNMDDYYTKQQFSGILFLNSSKFE